MNYGFLLNCIAPFAVAMAVTAVCTWRLIPALKRLHTVQSILEDAPETHKAKQGTPTMGGIAILLGIAAATVFTMVSGSFSVGLLSTLLTTVAFGLIGFIDDYTKVVRRRNKGLTARQKLALQIALSLAFGVCLVCLEGAGTSIVIPFVWVSVDIGWLIIPYMAFILVAMTNAVNLTDGLDGLCAGTCGVLSVFYPALIQLSGAAMLASAAQSYAAPQASAAVSLLAMEQSAEQILAWEQQAAYFFGVAGACFGFLLFNRHPAKIFMGDTGSLALGGAIAAGAIWAKAELLLPIAGLLFVLEALSVIIQVTSYRLRDGKRVFKMSPLHHHFELSGWKETKVVGRFVGFTVVMCAATAALLAVL
jgi:phospho-N-acetylmuramoyl-pentapeptide-transferase